MKLVVGLGNPDSHFDGTRHNSGFMALDFYANAHGADWQHKDKFKADATELIINGEKAIFLKPTTYYNLVGEAIQAVKQFYKIDTKDILVVHDELALPFGIIRTRRGGTAAGNNGIKSAISVLGEDFARIRIGIGNELLPRMDAADFVLGHFSAEERKELPTIFAHAGQCIAAFAEERFTYTTVTR